MKKFTIKMMRKGSKILLKGTKIASHLRGTGLLYRATNGMCIHSTSHPQLGSNHICIMGREQDRDTLVAIYHCTNASEAGKQLKRYKTALEEYKAKLESGELY